MDLLNNVKYNEQDVLDFLNSDVLNTDYIGLNFYNDNRDIREDGQIRKLYTADKKNRSYEDLLRIRERIEARTIRNLGGKY